jgi:hypothetical protein
VHAQPRRSLLASPFSLAVLLIRIRRQPHGRLPRARLLRPSEWHRRQSMACGSTSLSQCQHLKELEATFELKS